MNEFQNSVIHAHAIPTHLFKRDRHTTESNEWQQKEPNQQT